MVGGKKRFIVLLADGARYDVFQELLETGQLPNIEEVFLSEGTFAKATSSFPSTTGPAYMPFLTGCFPGTCNVPGIRWFDKQAYGKKRFSLNRYRSYVGFESFLINRDMRPELKTLFEYFPQSFNIFSSVNRGVPAKGNLTSQMRLWYWYYAHLTDHWHLVDKAALEKCLAILPTDFQFILTLFPGIDEFTHLSHCHHPEALTAYKNIHRAVKKIALELRRVGKLEETAMFIVSDHGLSETQTHFGVASFLERRGIKTFYYPKIFKWGFEAASMVSGNGMVHLYFKGQEGWKSRMPWEEIQEKYGDIIQELMEQPAVDLMVACDEEGWICVMNREGEAKVKEEGGRLYYSPRRGDPLGLGEGNLCLDHQQALFQTIDTRFPDSLLQLTQLFRSPRTGDLVLSAAKGHDLRKRFEFPEHKSSHGALHDEHMLTPLFSTLKMERSQVRSADLFPSILTLHGESIPRGIDGLSFFGSA